jgi:hypothetical protein
VLTREQIVGGTIPTGPMSLKEMKKHTYLFDPMDIPFERDRKLIVNYESNFLKFLKHKQLAK